MDLWRDMILVGRIARAHGNRGEVVVNLETDFPDQRFGVGRVVYMLRGNTAAPFTIEASRFQGGRPVIAFAGVNDMNAAEALAGEELRIPADAKQPLPEGSFYHYDLVGCQVVTEDGQHVGDVASVEGPMEMSRLVVRGERSEVLIPLASDICVRVEPGARQIVVRPIEGLLDLNEVAPKRSRRR